MTDVSVALRPPCWCLSEGHQHGVSIRGIEWSVENDASRKMSAQSRNLGILNKSLGISGSLCIEQSRSLEFLRFKNLLQSCTAPVVRECVFFALRVWMSRVYL